MNKVRSTRFLATIDLFFNSVTVFFVLFILLILFIFFSASKVEKLPQG